MTDDIRMESGHRDTAWQALAELFVGRELLARDYQDIAVTLASSGYSADELESILVKEVSPVLRSNVSLLAVPEMLGWDPAELRAAIANQRERRPSLWRQLLFRRPPSIVRARWREVRRLLAREEPTTRERS